MKTNTKFTSKVVSDAIEQGVIRVGVLDGDNVVEPREEDAGKNLAFSFITSVFELDRPAKSGLDGIENDIFTRLCRHKDKVAANCRKLIPAAIVSRHSFHEIDDKDSEVSFDGNYDEDSVYQVLQSAGPYLRKYRISFEGEDRARWILSKSDDGSFHPS